MVYKKKHVETRGFAVWKSHVSRKRFSKKVGDLGESTQECSCLFHGVSSGQIIATSAEVTLNGGLVRESLSNALNSGLGIIVICPASWRNGGMNQLELVFWLQRVTGHGRTILSAGRQWTCSNLPTTRTNTFLWWSYDMCSWSSDYVNQLLRKLQHTGTYAKLP